MLGVVEIGFALMIAARAFSPHISASGSIDATGLFAVTLTFLWLLLAALVCVAALVASGGLAVRWYSRAHVEAQLALRGRGVFFSRTPDGAWWRLRLRPCRRLLEDRGGWVTCRQTARSGSCLRRVGPDHVRARWR
ncbi:MAG: hypothetical protein M3376_00830 [Actinomycetota bacterium]|nr:hypothetical protein [Actinomycetota bacterium]